VLLLHGYSNLTTQERERVTRRTRVDNEAVTGVVEVGYY
jgi:hypothetical protein